LNSKKWEKLLSLQCDSEKDSTQVLAAGFAQFFIGTEKLFATDVSILIIGCTVLEKNLWVERGFKNLTCINYFPEKGIQKMDMHDLKFSNETFDVILAKNVFEHSFSPYLLLLEMRRVLKKDGLIVFTYQKLGYACNYLREHPTLTNEDWISWLGREFHFTKIREYDLKEGNLIVWRKNATSDDFIDEWDEEFQ